MYIQEIEWQNYETREREKKHTAFSCETQRNRWGVIYIVSVCGCEKRVIQGKQQQEKMREQRQ